MIESMRNFAVNGAKCFLERKEVNCMNDYLNKNVAAVLALLIEVAGFVYLFYGPPDDRAAVVGLMLMAPNFYYGASDRDNKPKS
jgi:hypothetical protein